MKAKENVVYVLGLKGKAEKIRATHSNNIININKSAKIGHPKSRDPHP